MNIELYTAPENSKFHIVYVDVVHRCNMECANCYLPNRDYEDMDYDKLIETISKFTRRTEFRLIGGEPTLHKKLPEIIKFISDSPLRHRATLVTNGLRMANKSYVEKLYDAGLRVVYLSMTGADSDDVYIITDKMKCAKKKMATLKNCAEVGINMAIGAILMPGINEWVPARLKEITDNLNINVSFEFRNVGQVGRYMIGKDENFTPEQILSILSNVFNFDMSTEKWKNSILENDDYSIYFSLEPDKAKMLNTHAIRITNWQPMNLGYETKTNLKRGRITENFMVAPFFEHLKENENGY